jgi:starch-binding outer membrane protein, SusD/RagB family
MLAKRKKMDKPENRHESVKKSSSSVLLFVLGFMMLMNFGCDDLLDVSSHDFVNEKDAFIDGFSARSSVLGVYALLQNVAEQYVILGELQGELVTVTQNADQDLIQVNEHNMDINNRYADPTNFFKVIVNCNEVMSKIHRVMELDNSVTNQEMNGYMAELILIRAWCYFAMVKIYGSIPYFEEPVSDYHESLIDHPNLNTLQSEDYVLDTLLKQLVAIDTFNLNINEISPYFSIRAKRSMNWALQGEIHLWRNNYAQAKKAYYHIMDLIASQGWAGMTRMPWLNTLAYNNVNWKNFYRCDYSSGDFESHAIFVIPFSKTYNQQNNLQRIFGYGEDGSYLLKPTDFIMNIYQAQKIVNWELQTEHASGTPGDLNRGLGVSYDSIDGLPVVTKYALFREPFDDDAGVIIYSAGDFHLSCCEAVCRLRQGVNAMEHLNQGKLYNSPWGMGVRARVNLQNISAANPGDIDEVENLILNERAMELSFEGHRWFDLVRAARHKNNPAFLADKIASKFSDPLKREEVRTRLLDQNNWYLPLILK